MSDTASASLPADMTAMAGVQGITGELKAYRSKTEDAEKQQEKGLEEKNKVLADKAKLTGEQRVESKQYAIDHPFPDPHIKPWEQKPPENNPIERFGSWASALGILAGAVTKTGLSSSLNAASSAMNAMRQNDLKAYDDAHAAWKENTEIAVKQAEWESKAYEHGWELMKTDQAAAQLQLEIAAEQAGNTQLAGLLRAGRYKEAYEMTRGIGDFVLSAPGKIQELGMIADQNRRLVQLNSNWQKANPGQQLPPEVALQNRMKVAKESSLPKELSPYQMEQTQKDIASFDSVFDRMDKLRNNLESFSVGLGAKFGRPVETIANILELSDDTTKSELLADMTYIKQNLPHLMTGTTRQLTSNESNELEKLVGGQATGSTIQNVTSRLNDLEESLMPRYDVLRRTANVGPRQNKQAGEGGGASAGPQEGDTATNPTTGAKVVYKNGTWTPVKKEAPPKDAPQSRGNDAMIGSD